MQKQRNQFIKANKMQKDTTANYRHTESLNYFYFKDEASHTHTPQINKERKQKKKGNFPGVVRWCRSCPVGTSSPSHVSSEAKRRRRRTSFSTRLHTTATERTRLPLSPNPNRLVRNAVILRRKLHPKSSSNSFLASSRPELQAEPLL